MSVLRWSLVLLVSMTSDALGQGVQISRQNKTIAVSISETVRVDADLAVVTIGFRNSANTKDEAFKENVHTASRILEALLGAGVAPAHVETEAIRMQRPYALQMGGAQEESVEAIQTWKIRVAVADAEKVVDVAVKAGANQVEDVQWTMADPTALQAKANSAALAKARAMAEKMAEQFGVKAGELLYLSNSEPEGFGGGDGRYAFSALSERVPAPEVKLFPKRVESRGRVFAVFSLE